MGTAEGERSGDSRELKAWRVFLGELLVNQLPVKRQMQFWQRMLQRWPDHETFLADAEPSRREPFAAFTWRRTRTFFSRWRSKLKEGLEWREWVRTDLKGLGRDGSGNAWRWSASRPIRSCSIGLGRMVGRINGSDESEQLLSRQRRELNLGLLLGRSRRPHLPGRCCRCRALVPAGGSMRWRSIRQQRSVPDVHQQELDGAQN